MKYLIAIMLGLTGSVYAADFSIPGLTVSDLRNRFSTEGVAVPDVTQISVARGDSSIKGFRDVEWVVVPGGTYVMGNDSGVASFSDAMPVHPVVINAFYMSKTDVTVEQYSECVRAGKCTEPAFGDNCNWGIPGRERHPVNCVTWDQAKRYARFMRGRLPTESEWEYAATGGGMDQLYPWGNAYPSNDLVDGYNRTTAPVCSRPAGNTVHGLCDMAGNVWQWMEDAYRPSYNGAPSDGSSVDTWSFAEYRGHRVIRGGAFFFNAGHTMHLAYPPYVRADCRYSMDGSAHPEYVGFRIARSSKADGSVRAR